MGILWWDTLFKYLSRNKITLDTLTDYFDCREAVELIILTDYPNKPYPTVEVSIAVLEEIEICEELVKGVDSLFTFYEPATGTRRIVLASYYGVSWSVNERRKSSKDTQY